ncbi:MAG: alpha/beta fold hydrolase [Thermomicrobia bacterium]|nr:alpha/beta fold hydrolase [Thermomicrobia bacterium]MCA1722725.1 alpha/beta fold hydrolase [Thermomicrobia bacterium]
MPHTPQPDTPRRCWVTSGETRFHYRVAGDGHTERLPLVLVHGLGVSSAYWARLQPLLATRRPVYALDLPGFGYTTRPHGILNTVALGGALADWMRAVGLARAHLLGHSLGGPVAAECACHHPERVARLILVGATIGTRGANAPHQTLGLLRDSVRESLSLLPVILRDYRRAGLRRVIGTDLAADDEDTIATVAGLTLPMLIVRGERDVVVPPRDTAHLRRAAPHAPFVPMARAAHAVQWGQPQALAAVVNAFLDAAP